MTSPERHGISNHHRFDSFFNNAFNKEIIKIRINGLRGNRMVRWILLTKGPVMRKAFPYHDIWCTQIIEYIMARWPYSFVCTLHYLSIIIMQAYLKVLNCLNVWQVHSVECVSESKSILSIIFHAIYGAVCIRLPTSLVMIVRMRILYLVIIIIINTEVRTNCCCLFFFALMTSLR